jgi:hypothetical protein
MKKILLLLFTLFSGYLTAQELKYSELTGSIKPKGPFKSYVSKHNIVFEVGDTLIIGYPSSNVFDFISNYSGGLQTLQALSGEPVDGPVPLSKTAMGSKSIIKDIKLAGSKRTGYFCNVYGKGMLGSVGSTYIIQIENAIDAGEIKTDIFASEDALNELKKAKEKLDLQLITQEQYDSIKLVLKKYIE